MIPVQFLEPLSLLQEENTAEEICYSDPSEVYKAAGEGKR